MHCENKIHMCSVYEYVHMNVCFNLSYEKNIRVCGQYCKQLVS